MGGAASAVIGIAATSVIALIAVAWLAKRARPKFGVGAPIPPVVILSVAAIASAAILALAVALQPLAATPSPESTTRQIAIQGNSLSLLGVTIPTATTPLGEIGQFHRLPAFKSAHSCDQNNEPILDPETLPQERQLLKSLSDNLATLGSAGTLRIVVYAGHDKRSYKLGNPQLAQERADCICSVLTKAMRASAPICERFTHGFSHLSNAPEKLREDRRPVVFIYSEPQMPQKVQRP